MTMEEWAKRLDKFLEADDRDILKKQRKNYGSNGKRFCRK